MTSTVRESPLTTSEEPTPHKPYVPDEADLPELTWGAVLLGAILGIIFGASSLYLVLKIGLTVSASIPVAVLSITVFRILSKVLHLRRATILENNIVQTTGSAGESIAFGVGVTIPALLLLGFDMDAIRVMTVGVLGSLLGILMMIPLRRAFVVRQHGRLTYPEGTACADVLVAGERGGATARMVFTGFGIAFVCKVLMDQLKLWKDTFSLPLSTPSGGGLPGAVLGGEMTPELLGVGYVIGPRVGATMFAGGVLAYLILAPMIVFFSAGQSAPIPPATLLVRQMGPSGLRDSYILYIGAGAVAAGGIISMFQSFPLILSSLRAGLRDLGGGANGARRGPRRTERDLSLKTVVFGSIGLVVALAAAPELGLGLSPEGIAGAILIVVFGFLFVTVSSRITGEIGSSSNPISGMTVATLLFTCLAFLLLGRTQRTAMLTAITVAAVVCIASSNAGGTAQDLKTGYLLGATPRRQQFAILIGALTSALFIGGTLLLLNRAGTVYTTQPQYLPKYHVPDVAGLRQLERPGGEYAAKDPTLYHVFHVIEGEVPGVPQGEYLVDDSGRIRYLVDPAINGKLTRRDDGTPVPDKFDAPKTRLMALIVQGILGRKLPWALVLTGVLIAIAVELLGIQSLPFAVGVYLPITTSFPIFLGGLVRWIADRVRRRDAVVSDMSPGTLLATGYIAGGTIGGVVIAFLTFLPSGWIEGMDLSRHLPAGWNDAGWPAVIAFAVILIILLLVGMRHTPVPEVIPAPRIPPQ